MNAKQALNAIEARRNGVFAHPDLMEFGPLDTIENDVRDIKRAFLDDCGFTVGARDPGLNYNYPGDSMACECLDEKTGPTPDGSEGPWTVVGDFNKVVDLA